MLAVQLDLLVRSRFPALLLLRSAFLPSSLRWQMPSWLPLALSCGAPTPLLHCPPPQVATANGNLYCIATAAAYHPMKSWPQQHVGGGTFTAR